MLFIMPYQSTSTQFNYNQQYMLRYVKISLVGVLPCKVVLQMKLNVLPYKSFSIITISFYYSNQNNNFRDNVQYQLKIDIYFIFVFMKIARFPMPKSVQINSNQRQRKFFNLVQEACVDQFFQEELYISNFRVFDSQGFQHSQISIFNG